MVTFWSVADKKNVLVKDHKKAAKLVETRLALI